MRVTKRFERRITTPYFKVGTLKKTLAQTTATITGSAGLPFDNLTLYGSTVQPIPNRAEVYRQYFTSETRYVSAGTNGAYSIALPAEFIGKELNFSISTKASGSGAALYLADASSALFATLTPLCSSSGKAYAVSGSTFTHLIFTNVETTDKETDDGSIILVRDGIIDFWAKHELVVTSAPSPDFFTPVSSVGESGTTLTLSWDGKNNAVNLPVAVTSGNETVTLRLSRYDSITVNRKAQSVIYRDGTVVFDLTGNEAWKIKEDTAAQGKGIFAYAAMSTAFSEGFCPYLTYVTWIPNVALKNVFSVFNSKNLAIKLERNEKDPSYYKEALNEITRMLKTRYNSSAGVSILARRKQIIDRDISNTSLGKALLNLTLPRGSNGTLTLAGTSVAGRVEVQYYALNEADVAPLTVVFQNENGEEISQRKEYLIRKGSLWQLSAPEIDGYTPTSGELFGAITEGETVVIEYKEEK